METETTNLKTVFKHLEMIYNNSIGCFENQLTEKPCENYTVLKIKWKISFKNLWKVHKK